jgi:DNA invertase Pin-like site-specific DNA recombinase
VTGSPESLSKVKSGAGAPSSIKGSSRRRAVGIVRVSRVGDREAKSPTEQRERIEAECKRLKLRLVEVMEELDVSGGAALERRPGLSRAVELIEAGKIDVVVVAYFDRLFRSLPVQQEVTERVEKAGGEILAVDVGKIRADSASHWMTGTFLGAVAEYHRRATAERTEDAKRRSVADGIPPFPNLPPYLERTGKAVRVNAKNARTVKKAAEMRAGGATIAAVREHLRKHGIERSYHGTQALLESRMLLGELRFGDYVNETAFTPVIDPETFQRLQRVTVRRGRRPKSDRLLARLDVLRCGTCDARMVVGTSQNKYAFYRCPPIGDCPRRVTIGAEIAEETVITAVQDLLAGIEGSASVESGVMEAAEDLDRKQDALDAAIRAFDGLGEEQAARERLQALREARDEARDRHDRLVAASAPAITVTAGDWDDLTVDERRALIQAVIHRAVVKPGRGAERITIEPRS